MHQSVRSIREWESSEKQLRNLWHFSAALVMILLKLFRAESNDDLTMFT
jgi:hypothetical protein